MNKTIKILRIALETAPENWETRRHLAELLLDEGAPQDAQEILAATPSVPENEEDELFIAEHLVTAQPTMAAPFVDRALRRNKGCAQAHWLKAHVFLALGLTEDARKHYTTATVLDDAYMSSEFEASLDGPVSAPEPVAKVEVIPEPELTVEPELVLEPKKAKKVVTVAKQGKRPAADASSKLATSAGAIAVVASQQPAPKAAALGAVLAQPTPSQGLNSSQLASRIEATQMKAKKKSRATAVLLAGILHAVIVLLCLFWILKPGALQEPTVIMSVKAPEDHQEQVEKKAIAQNLPQKPSSSSASRVAVIAADTTSALAVPVVEIEEITDDIFGAGDSFGMGSGWGDGAGGGGGGSVRFFGEEKKAQRVCYIVDFSGSMAGTNSEGDTRQAVLKRELIESIDKLDPAMRYTVIFFSGMPWLEDEKSGDRAVMGRQGMQDIALDVTWKAASKKNKQETISRIKGMALAGTQTGGGTIWMSGFRPAMKIAPKADLVYLLTDGICQDYIKMDQNASINEFLNEFITNKKAWETFRDTMLALVPTGVSLNTISMEMPGTVAARLAELALKTGGDFSIVNDGKTYTGKRALKFGDKKYDEF